MDMDTVVTILKFFMDPTTLAVIFAALWSVSEALALIPAVKANSVFQAIHNILKSVKGKFLGTALILILAFMVVSCASTNQAWDKLNNDQKTRVVVSGVQKQLETLFNSGKDFVDKNPQYEQKWKTDIVPMFDKANKVLRASIFLAQAGTGNPNDVISQAEPIMQSILDALVSIGAIKKEATQ